MNQRLVVLRFWFANVDGDVLLNSAIRLLRCMLPIPLDVYT
ncbi:MAG TPA: hypothetical protein VGG85_19460 [Terracidiphilus sp.]